MSGKVVSLIALVPMLFHSMFGCCWHHAHFLPDHEPAATIAAGEVSAPEQVPSRHAGCRHSHALPVCASEAGAQTENHSSEFPPCDEEERCLYNGMATTVITQLVSFEVWDSIPFAFADLEWVQRSPLTVWSDLIEQSLSKSARERCALTQVWLV